MVSRIQALYLAALTLVGVVAARAQEPIAQEPMPREPISLSATLGYHFSTGDYGGSDTTRISFVPLTLSARYAAFATRLTVPYINVSGADGFVDTGGVVVTGNGSGLGDVTFDAMYGIDPLAAWMPYVDLTGRVKFPTADEDDGLGTGKFDYQLELGATHQFGRVTPFASFGYRFVGDPADFDLDNVWLASAGAMVRIVESVDAGIFLFYQESASTSVDDQLDLMPYLDWRITDTWSVSSYVTAGLLEGSPDVGVGLQLTYATGF